MDTSGPSTKCAEIGGNMAFPTPEAFTLRYECNSDCGHVISVPVVWSDPLKFEADRVCICGKPFRMSQVILIDVDVELEAWAVFYVFGDYTLEKTAFGDLDVNWETEINGKKLLFSTLRGGNWIFPEAVNEEVDWEGPPYVMDLYLEILEV